MTAIDNRRLGRNGPEVSRLCLGTMMFGDQTSEDEAAAILEAYFEAGGNFIDCADTYAGGRSEKMLRKLLPESADITLATKVGNPVPEIDDAGGLSPQRILRAAELSRERLGRECLDLYYLHLDDPLTPLDEIVDALGKLIASGAIAMWGFSNFRPWKIAEMVRVADRLGVARPVAAQPYYHMLNRTAEADYLPACRHFDIGVVSYSPLARGVLTGKYRAGTPEDLRAARGDVRMQETEFYPETLARASDAAAHAEKTGRSPASLAVQWVLANDAVTSVLAGPKTRAQLDGYLDALQTTYTADDEAYLAGLCASGHLPVPEHSDPRYPFDGRRVTTGAGE